MEFALETLLAGGLALVAGVAFGIFGAGGSILLVPILVYVLHLPVKVSLGMALLILVLTGGIAALAHARSGNIRWKVGLQWSLLGIVGAYAGGRVAEFIHPTVLLIMFAVVVVVSATGMISGRGPGRIVDAAGKDPSFAKVSVVGLVLGFLTGLIGVGGGFLLVPALVLLCGMDVKRAIGTSLIIISFKSLGGFLGFAHHTQFPIVLTITIAAFNAVGSIVGERIGKPLPPGRLRPAFAIFLLVVGAVMVVQNIIEITTGKSL